MCNFSGIIFDLDGTLADSLMDIGDAMNRTLAHFNYPTYTYNDYKYFVGNGLKNLVNKCLPADKKEEKYVEETLSVMMQEYGESYADKTILYPGIPELLDEFIIRKYKLAVLSNKADNLTQKIASHLLSNWPFEIIMGASELFPRKPDLIAALFIADKLNIQPQNMLYVGDTNTDMQTANSAGMYAVGVTWGFREKKELVENGAKIIIDHPMDLIKYL